MNTPTQPQTAAEVKQQSQETGAGTIEGKPTETAMAVLMRDRQDRSQRCAQAIQEALQRERCIMSAPIGVTEDGRIVAPHIKVQALD